MERRRPGIFPVRVRSPLGSVLQVKMPIVLYLFLRIAVLFLCENCPEGVLNFYMPGNFRTRAHSEQWDMAFDSKMPCLVLKSLDGHEMGRQATDLDENFGTPYSF